MLCAIVFAELSCFNSFPGEIARNTPYEVNITIPVEGYEPIQFVLTKMCGEYF
jgi:hypothetical protein